ncbi:caspase family protein [Pseudomonas neuropathica]|uniref:caspase family protein n=1 Tax=Pseudomonas neuropathica TaxID=2730425 RepID=UPI003EBF4D0E
MKRYGLVIGNAAYASDPLDNTLNDAHAVHDALLARGFDALLVCDATGEQMTDAVKALKEKLEPGDLFFFFFAGHAFEYLGYGYLLPVDIPEFSAGAIRMFAYPVEELLRDTQELDLTRVIVLDACRIAFNDDDHSVQATIESIHEDRARVEKSQRNLLLAYSTSYGETASDGHKNNSPFVETFAPLLLDHRLSIEGLFKEVGCQVIRNTKNRQRPWFYSSLESELKLSDLPSYQQRQSYFALTKDSLNALAASTDKKHLLLVADSSRFFILGSHGPEKTFNCKEGVAVACVSNNGLTYFLNKKGHLIVPHLSGQIDLEAIDPIGMVVSFDGEFLLVYGHQSYVVFRVGPDACKCIYEAHVPSQYFYCAAFVDESEVWIGGEGRDIHTIKLDCSEPDCTIRTLPFWVQVYAITPLDDQRVVLAGTEGLIHMFHRGAGVAGMVMSLGASVRLPSSRRSSLINLTDDLLINDFLFSPKSIDSDDLHSLREHLQSNILLYAVCSATLPLLAIGSSEGIVTIIDIRNWDAYQQLDASGGRETELTGLAFTADNTLVVATKDRHVLFYAPVNEDYSTSLAYVDSLE